MSEVNRYDGKIKHVGDGGYVSYKDYAELKAQRDALASENDQLRQINALCGEMANSLLSEEDAQNFAAQLRAGKDGE